VRDIVSSNGHAAHKKGQAKGIRLPLSDLLIGVRALELGYSVATGNLRHFKMIPGLSVVQF
jgi:predicted nucleic acid-binding protein